MSGPATVDAGIAGFPPEVQALLQRVRDAIRKTASDATEKIAYGIPTFVLHDNLVHFAAYKSHIGCYLSRVALAEFADMLTKYETARGTVRLPLDKPILFGLISKIVELCVKHSLAQHTAKPKPQAKP
jgi:uncharacterized protein YdhG (YjbR/CyaY superfamily)